VPIRHGVEDQIREIVGRRQTGRRLEALIRMAPAILERLGLMFGTKGKEDPAEVVGAEDLFKLLEG